MHSAWAAWVIARGLSLTILEVPARLADKFSIVRLLKTFIKYVKLHVYIKIYLTIN